MASGRFRSIRRCAWSRLRRCATTPRKPSAAAVGDVEDPVSRAVIGAVEDGARGLLEREIDAVVGVNHREARRAAPAAFASMILRARRNVENKRVARVRQRGRAAHRRRECEQLEADAARAHLDAVERLRRGDDVDVDARTLVRGAQRCGAVAMPLGVIEPIAVDLVRAQQAKRDPAAGRVRVPAQNAGARRFEEQRRAVLHVERLREGRALRFAIPTRSRCRR